MKVCSWGLYTAEFYDSVVAYPIIHIASNSSATPATISLIGLKYLRFLEHWNHLAKRRCQTDAQGKGKTDADHRDALTE